MRVIHDQGSEFIGAAFQNVLARAGIKSVPASARNLQGNSIIKSVHKTISNVLHTLIAIDKPQTRNDPESLAKQALLATAMQ